MPYAELAMDPKKGEKFQKNDFDFVNSKEKSRLKLDHVLFPYT
jgi:hypothetical protein